MNFKWYELSELSATFNVKKTAIKKLEPLRIFQFYL